MTRPFSIGGRMVLIIEIDDVKLYTRLGGLKTVNGPKALVLETEKELYNTFKELADVIDVVNVWFWRVIKV